MCGHQVIETVRATILSRRTVQLAAGAAGAVGGPMRTRGPDAVRPTFAPTGRVEDLTHTLSPEFPTYSGMPQFSSEQTKTLAADGYNLFVLTVDEHTGTHLDAPLHFSDDGCPVDLLPVADFVAPLVVVDIRARAAADPDAELTPDDLDRWVARHGPLPERCCVAVATGWDAHLGTPMFRNADAAGTMHFPGVHPDAAVMLASRSSAVGIAVDTLSLDRGATTDFGAHVAWLGSGHWALECVARLSTLPPVGATIVVGAPKHAGGSGGPSRVLAFV